MMVRQAKTEDAAVIMAITNAIIRDTLVTFNSTEREEADIVEDIKARGKRFLVAETDGSVVGFATYGPFRGGPGYAHSREHTIQLKPEARSRGVGHALMNRLEEVARVDGVHVLVAGISADNRPAIRFHSAIGFSEVGRMPEVGRKWGRWLDLVLMQKILAQE